MKALPKRIINVVTVSRIEPGRWPVCLMQSIYTLIRASVGSGLLVCWLCAPAWTSVSHAMGASEPFLAGAASQEANTTLRLLSKLQRYSADMFIPCSLHHSLLPMLARQLIMHMLFLEAPVPVADFLTWVRPQGRK